MTPMQFYKRFGFDTSFYYVGGTFIVHEMYKEWEVDKSELIKLCKINDCMNSLISEFGSIRKLKKEILNLGDNDLFFFVYDGYESCKNKDYMIDMINTFLEMNKK